MAIVVLETIDFLAMVLNFLLSFLAEAKSNKHSTNILLNVKDCKSKTEISRILLESKLGKLSPTKKMNKALTKNDWRNS